MKAKYDNIFDCPSIKQEVEYSNFYHYAKTIFYVKSGDLSITCRLLYFLSSPLPYEI